MLRKFALLSEIVSTKPMAKRLEKSSISRTAATALITLAGLMLSAHIYSQTTPNGAFSLTLKNVDIRSLIETVSAQTGKNFIIDPRVKATVTVITSEPVGKDELYELFLSVLQVHGYATVPAGDFTKIVPMTTGVQSAVPVIAEPTDTVDELVTEVIQLFNVPAVQLIESLRPLLPQTATLSAEANSNTIIITDRAANIARLKQIIRKLDS